MSIRFNFLSPGRRSIPSADEIDQQLSGMTVVVVLGAIMTILDATIVNVAIDTLVRSFGTSLSVVQWALTGYTLALAVSIPITGWTVRRYGAKNMWIFSLALFIFGSLLCASAWSIGSLIAFRVVQGIGGGMVMPVGQTLLAKAAGPQRMGRVMGAITVPAMLGPVLGPPLGGLIVTNFSWRWIFLVNIPLCVVALAVALRILPRDHDDTSGQRLDVPGLLLLSSGLASMLYGLANAPGNVIVFSVGVGLGSLLLGAFAVRSIRTTRNTGSALLDVAVIKERAFASGMSAFFLYSTALFGLMFMLPIYYQSVHGQRPLAAGMLIAPLGLGAMVTIPLAGKITDHRGARGVAVVGLLTAIIGMSIYTQLTPETSMILLVCGLFVVGLGHGLISPSSMAAALRGFPREKVADATIMANIIARLSASFGGAGSAVILQSAIRSHVPGAGGQLAEVVRFRTPIQLNELSKAFDASIWWALSIVAVAVFPAALIPLLARSRKGVP